MGKYSKSGTSCQGKFFTVLTLAERWGVDPQFVYRRLYRKEIRGFQLPASRTWRIAREEVERIEQQKQGICELSLAT